MSSQHTALFLRKKANEAEKSAISHQKTKSILFQNLSFSKVEQVESDTGRIWGNQDLTCISPRIKCQHSQIVFRPQ